MIPSLVGNGSKMETIRGSFQLGRLEKYSPVRSKVSWIYTRNIVLEKRIKYLLGGEKLEYPKKLSRKIIKSFKTKLSSPFLVNSSRRGRWWNDRNKRRKGGVVKNLRAGRLDKWRRSLSVVVQAVINNLVEKPAIRDRSKTNRSSPRTYLLPNMT